jgi:hypothetical protein
MRFHAEGYILAACNDDEIHEKLEKLREFKPKKRENHVEAVVARVADFINNEVKRRTRTN